ncbi:type IV pilus assembly protein PilM [Candidatus Fermentibacterales bacterium]|nr:type IV pilus assembly protein PilM [Candidatus Fermentibacterales bacterium]
MMFSFGKGGKSAVGLDIGSHSVKAVELIRSGKSLKLSRYGVQELLPGTVVDGEVVNREHLIATIRDVLRSAGIKPKNVFSAVSGRSVIVRRIPMEKMSEEDARQAIHWEAEQHIPFRIDEVSLDFKIVNPEISPGQMEVLLVAAKREVVDLHRSLLQSAGVRPVAIELEQFALQRAFQNAYLPPEDLCVTIINIGAEVTNMVVVRGGLPSFNRDLAIGGNRFIEALQRSLGLDYEVAEKVLRGELPEGVSNDDVRSAIGYVIEELSTSIRRSFISFQASGESNRIDKMYISGGCSLVPGLATILSEQHGLPVEPLQPFANLIVDDSVIPDDERATLGALLTVSAGLALRGFEPGRVDINVLEEAGEGRRKRAKAAAPAAAGAPSISRVLSYVPLILVVAGVVALGLHYKGVKDKEKKLQDDIAVIDEQIAQMQTQLQQQEMVNNLAEEVAARQRAIQSLALNQRFSVYVMEYLCRALYPEQAALAEEAEKGIYLTSLIISGNSSIRLTGIARTWGDIVEFQQRLTELKPDGSTSLFSLPDYGQTYMMTTVAGAGVAGAGSDVRYQFDMEVGVNSASLEPLVGDYVGI